MLVIPAIDLMSEKVVRLTRGDPNTAKSYDQWGSPVQVAKYWKDQGAKRLHIIDLDAAFGTGANTSVIGEIAEATALPIQVGGGIRTIDAIEGFLKFGIDHVILGSLAFSHPELIPEILEKFGCSTVIIALDNNEGKVMVDGWRTGTSLTVAEALNKFALLGVKTFLITSIAKDGVLSGPDVETLKTVCNNPEIQVIAAGGIGRLKDLVALKQIGLEGAVVGKALYEQRFTLSEAIATVEDE